MEIISLCDGLLDALEEFDNEVLPLGIYSVNEPQPRKRLQSQEWERAIVPFLEEHGYRVERSVQASWARLQNQEGESAALSTLRFSNIKVRKYGSGFR
jgi:hypothetical protein